MFFAQLRMDVFHQVGFADWPALAERALRFKELVRADVQHVRGLVSRRRGNGKGQRRIVARVVELPNRAYGNYQHNEDKRKPLANTS